MAITRDDKSPTRSTRRGSGGSFAPTRTGSGGSFAPTNRARPPAPQQARPATTRSAPVAPSTPYSGSPGSVGPYSIDGGIGGGGGIAGAAAAAPSEEDYLAGDASYQAQVAALLRALKDYEADDTAQRTKYETDYKEGIKQLGWTPDDPATADINEGAWNWNDQLTASGRAATAQDNDFAARGMLQSSAFARARNDLQRSFNDQLGSVNRARTDFLSDRDRELASFKNENLLGNQSARAEALARRAAQYGV